jgi:uncharacterized SAM-binding protein YcdF (DUF218 family)
MVDRQGRAAQESIFELAFAPLAPKRKPMSMVAVFLLVAAALVAIAFRRRRYVAFFLGLAIALMVLIGGGLIPSLALARIQTHGMLVPHWKSRNAIIVLGFGTTRWPTGEITSHLLAASRVEEGARLYFSCKKAKAKVCKMILTGGDPWQTGTSEAEAMAQDFKNLGVDEADVSIETRSQSTWENAKFVKPMWEVGEFQQTVLVTSGTHLSRALMYFNYFGIQAQGAPSDHLVAPITVLPVAANFAFFDFVIHEYLGVLRYKYERWREKNGGGSESKDTL